MAGSNRLFGKETSHEKKAAFTLIELLVVIAVMAVLRWNGSADIFLNTPENWLKDSSLTDEWYAVD